MYCCQANHTGHEVLFPCISLNIYCIEKYRQTPVSIGNTFQDLPRLRETVDNTERYI